MKLLIAFNLLFAAHASAHTECHFDDSELHFQSFFSGPGFETLILLDHDFSLLTPFFSGQLNLKYENGTVFRNGIEIGTLTTKKSRNTVSGMLTIHTPLHEEPARSESASFTCTIWPMGGRG